MTDDVQRYHKVSIILHWLIGFALIANLALGVMLEDIPDAMKGQFYQLHKSLGISVLLLTALRILWRFIKPAPPELPSMAGWEKVVARVTYALFYVLMIGIPLSGWAVVSASPLNIPTVLFGVIPWPHLPFFAEVVDRKALAHDIKEVHEMLSNGMIVLLLLHVAAALRHHLLLKDETLLRMTPAHAAKCLLRLRGGKA